MSCHGCAAAFGFLKKEVGCPKCGFSFCKNCLRFKVLDQKSTHKTLSVCQNCYTTNGAGTTKGLENEELTRQWKETATAIRAVQRLESLENPAKPPITVYRDSTAVRLSNLQKGLSLDDQKIVERLKELRSGGDDQNRRRKSETTEEEVAARLARLRGEEPPSASAETASRLYPSKKPETEDELLHRLATQVEIDKNYEAKMIGDIDERLAKLRGSPSDPSATSSTAGAGAGPTRSVPDMNMELDEIMDESDEMSEEQQIQKIINQFVAEVALEEKFGGFANEFEQGESTESNVTAEPDSDESIDDDIVCRICEEKRAILKCKECDNDIFCRACFKEFHFELGENHKSTALTAP